MRKHHRAGAAVALAATLLGPRRARLLAQPIEQRRPRRKTVERAGFTAKAEGKVSSGIRRGWARNHVGPRLVGQSYHDPGSIAPFNTREAHWRKIQRALPNPLNGRTALTRADEASSRPPGIVPRRDRGE